MQSENVAGKTVIVTGANTGLGLETARGLAHMGAHVVLVCRDRGKGEYALAALKKETGNKNLYLMVADLSLLSDILNFVQDFKSRFKQLHVLVNNAGIYTNEFAQTEEGLEKTFATNHMGPFLLTTLLLDTLKATAKASGSPTRIVNVASRAHHRAQLNLNDLQMDNNFNAHIAYSNSKLCNILFTYELARRLQGENVTVNALHPGVVTTQMISGVGGMMGFFFRFFKPFHVSPSKGARTSIFLASAPELASVSGQYFAKEKPTRSSPQSYDLQLAAGLWQASENIAQSILN